jgi:hypothetical protein
LGRDERVAGDRGLAPVVAQNESPE